MSKMADKLNEFKEVNLRAIEKGKTE